MLNVEYHYSFDLTCDFIDLSNEWILISATWRLRLQISSWLATCVCDLPSPLLSCTNAMKPGNRPPVAAGALSCWAVLTRRCQLTRQPHAEIQPPSAAQQLLNLAALHRPAAPSTLTGGDDRNWPCLCDFLEISAMEGCQRLWGRL